MPPSFINGQRFDPPLGLNDGTLFATSFYPEGTPAATIAREAQRQPNLKGKINVLVVLVSFSNKAIKPESKAYIEDVFFSKGKREFGSLTEYYTDVSDGQFNITGDVIGPYTLPKTMEEYANGSSGMKGAFNVRNMADDTVTAVEKDTTIDLRKYDNKGRADGFVDGFIIVHAGEGAESTEKGTDIWSVKWTLPNDTHRKVGVSKTEIFSFLTVPENAEMGLCAHEFGHLLFGWPDLYDRDNESAGIGGWCLMSSGNWGRLTSEKAQGTLPCHPSAWCKADQGWGDIVEQAGTGDIDMYDVKARTRNTVNVNQRGKIQKLWPNGVANGKEYFLLESRKRTGYDRSLPGEGLLIWHIDDNQSDNRDTNSNYHVALVSADGQPKIALNSRGNGAQPFPGTLNKKEFTPTTTPNSKSFAGADTSIRVRNINDFGQFIKMTVSVRPQNTRASGGARL